MDSKMGEGRNPEEELRGWTNPVRQEKDLKSNGKVCHISNQPLYRIGTTVRKRLPVWASEADGRPDKKEGVLKLSLKKGNKSLTEDEDPPLAMG